MNARRRIALLLSLALAAVPLAACGGSQGTAEEGDDPSEATAGMPNPFVDCDSAYAASELAGFDVTFPESVPGHTMRRYQAIEGEMAQCFYFEDDVDDADRVLIRKAADDGSGDISGDYNEYKKTTTVTVGDVKVTEKGDGKTVDVAIWSKDGYLFAIDAQEAGLTAAEIEALVAATF